MKKPRSKTSKKAKAKKRTPAEVSRDFVLAVKAIKRVAVPKNLLPVRERAINSIYILNTRLNAEAGKIAKTAERETAKAVRAKAKAARVAAKVVRDKARAATLKKRIAAMQAQVKKLG